MQCPWKGYWGRHYRATERKGGQENCCRLVNTANIFAACNWGSEAVGGRPSRGFALKVPLAWVPILAPRVKGKPRELRSLSEQHLLAERLLPGMRA